MAQIIPFPTNDEYQEDWGALEDHLVNGEFRPPATKTVSIDTKNQRFPCPSCGGSGQWRGRGKCFACKGKGYFLTSERDRQKARQRSHESKAKSLASARELFEQNYPDITPALADFAKWSPFAADLLTKLNQYGSLTAPQVAAIRNMAAKAALKTAERAREIAAGSAEVDLSPVRAMFETAYSNGYKRPTYRAAGLVITRAPDSGKNPGALYVCDEADNYLGKIIGTSYTGKPATALQLIAADPKGEAIKYGQRTGKCSCCGRLLTNEESISLGIGPICRDKWGL
jgi:hypothetical protein